MSCAIGATVVTVALSVLAAPLTPAAQAPVRAPRIGFMSSSVTAMSSPFLAALRQGLSDLGYVEGKSITIEYRLAQKTETLPALAAELVSLPVDVIVAGGSEAVSAAKGATRTIPIVMTNSGDAVRAGFVARLARPGGTITGLTQISPDLAGKRLQLLTETSPRVSRVAVLWHPLHPNTPFTFAETKAAAQQLGLQLLSLEVKEPKDFDEAFAAAARGRAEALVVLRDPFTVRHRVLIAETATKRRLPAIYETSDFVEAGGLMYYGTNLADLYRRSAGYIDKILKGVKPGDLPVEQPTKFELAVNLKTARVLGLTLPRSILIRADQVIQ